MGMNLKIKRLIEQKEKELNVHVVDFQIDDKQDVHFLAKRNTRGDYAVWSAYYSGDTSYENFYSGFYSDSLITAVEELKERIEKAQVA